jgi:hypothetical protein
MAGYKTWAVGEEVLAADFNSYIQTQVVARFANASTRTAQLPAPGLNQLSTLDTAPGIIYFWSGSAWVAMGGAREVNFAATPNAAAPQGGTGTAFPFSVTLPVAGTLIVQGSAAVYRDVPGTSNSSAWLRCGQGGNAGLDSNFQVAPDLGWSTVPFFGSFGAQPAGLCSLVIVFFVTSVNMRLFNYQGSVRIQPV